MQGIQRNDARETRSNTRVTETGTRRIENVLEVEKAKLEIRKNGFNVRAAKLWNSIPEPVRTQKSVNAFKNAYDAWIAKKPIIRRHSNSREKKKRIRERRQRSKTSYCANSP